MLKHWRPFLFGLFVGLLSTGLILLLSRSDEGVPVRLDPPPSPAPTATPRPLRVHVTGAVHAPGVYEFDTGAIVSDALAAAGGVSPSANLAGLNLAQPLTDGMQVFIAEKAPQVSSTAGAPGEDTAAESSTVSTAAETAGGGSGPPININTATAEELDALPRIGPAYAQRIIEYREANGPFETVEEIMNVRGIGEVTFEALRDLITVGP